MATSSKPPAILRTLQAAAEGLLFPSESDRPITAFAWKPEETKGAVTAEDAIAAMASVEKANLKGVSVAEFFKHMTTAQEWHSEEEKASVAKAKALVQMLNAVLTGVRVYRVEGSTVIPAYVVGKDPEGNWAGVATVLIET